jgi:hypothetical protein
MNRTLHLRTLVVLAITLGSLAARADVTAEWAAIAASSAQEARQSPQAAARSLRTVQEAIAKAAAAARNASPGAAAERHDAAVAVAAFAVLEHLYPDQRESLEARLAISFSRIPENAAKADGAAIGRLVTNEMLVAGRR